MAPRSGNSFTIFVSGDSKFLVITPNLVVVFKEANTITECYNSYIILKVNPRSPQVAQTSATKNKPEES